MSTHTSSIVQTLLGLPVFQSEWVLWLLLGLSLVSLAVILERFIFYRLHAVDVTTLRQKLTALLERGDYQAAADLLATRDALETNVVLAGIKNFDKGPESVEDLVAGALGGQKARYEKRLSFLATLASNAPYIGLFGTVLGIIRSFRDLAANMSDASAAVMGGIAEALLATAVGLLVAIPAVIAFNFFRGKVKQSVTDAQMLARILLAQLKSLDLAPRSSTTSALVE